MCQNSFAFTQASGPSADCIALTLPGSALTNGFVRAEAAQHLPGQEPTSTLGPSWTQAQEIAADSGQQGRAPVPTPGPQLGLYWRDKLPPLGVIPDLGHRVCPPRNWTCAGAAQYTFRQVLSFHYRPDRWGLALARARSKSVVLPLMKLRMARAGYLSLRMSSCSWHSVKRRWNRRFCPMTGSSSFSSSLFRRPTTVDSHWLPVEQ